MWLDENNLKSDSDDWAKKVRFLLSQAQDAAKDRPWQQKLVASLCPSWDDEG